MMAGGVNRVPRTATVAIIALTCVAWLVAHLLGLDDRAAAGLGFIPARASGFIRVVPAVPAFLTPLTATLVLGAGPTAGSPSRGSARSSFTIGR